jgi:DNA-binding MarR family transcriptional regulator
MALIQERDDEAEPISLSEEEDLRSGPRAVCREVAHIGRLLASVISQRLAELGVRTGHLATLLALYERDGQTQAELTRTVGVEQPSMVATLRRMEAADLVRRDPDPDDRRRAIVTLTPKAQEIRTDVQGLRREIAAEALADFTTEERASMLGMLNRLAASLEELTR